LEDAESQISRFDAIEPTDQSRNTESWFRSIKAHREALSNSLPIERRQIANKHIDVTVSAEALQDWNVSPEQVQRLLSEVCDASPPLGRALALRALISANRGRLAAALRDAQRAIELDPRAANGFRVRGRVRIERGQSGGLDDLERAAELTNRTDAGVLHDLAYAYSAVGRPDEALAAQRKAAELNPGSAEIQGQLREFESAKK
jgi:tetratricopeptide (TPR) repeat protein